MKHQLKLFFLPEDERAKVFNHRDYHLSLYSYVESEQELLSNREKTLEENFDNQFPEWF